MSQILELMKSRRSIRRFTSDPVSEETITSILEAGQWSPSGKNNQPWRFAVTRNSTTREQLAALTKYSRIVNESQVCITILFHKPTGYHREKDYMSIGACIQNMLLYIHSVGLGAVWLGEILKSEKEVLEVLGLDDQYELAAVIALGHPDESAVKERHDLETLVVYDD